MTLEIQVPILMIPESVEILKAIVEAEALMRLSPILEARKVTALHIARSHLIIPTLAATLEHHMTLNLAMVHLSTLTTRDVAILLVVHPRYLHIPIPNQTLTLSAMGTLFEATR